MAQGFGLLHPQGDPGNTASDWPSTGCCGYRENELAHGRSLFLLTLLFKIKIKLNLKNTINKYMTSEKTKLTAAGIPSGDFPIERLKQELATYKL